MDNYVIQHTSDTGLTQLPWGTECHSVLDDTKGAPWAVLQQMRLFASFLEQSYEGSQQHHLLRVLQQMLPYCGPGTLL